MLPWPRRSLAATSARAARLDPALPVILEFQSPSGAVINAPIPASARHITWMIGSLVAALILILGLIPVDRVVTAPGIVVSESPTIVVQPLDTAIVRAIMVHEGQRVRAGELLARLDPTFAAADAGALSAQVASLAAEVARLTAESAAKPFAYEGSDPDMLLQASIFAHRQAEFGLKMQYYAQKIEELTALTSRSELDVAGYRNRVGVARSIEQMRQELQQREVGSRLNTLVAQDNRAEMARALDNADQTAKSTRRDLAALTSERDGYVQSWRGDILQKLADAGRKLSDAREQLNKANLRRQLVELRAERDATVLSVAKVSVGSVLQSGQQFITLVPTGAAMAIEANISGQNTGFVHVGDPVAIKFDTFPYAQYGMAEGSVRIISPDAFTARDEQRNPTSALPVSPASLEPYYRARIAIDRVALHGLPASFEISPGMPVTADIKVGRRTVLKYLLGRVLPVVEEGMREP